MTEIGEPICRQRSSKLIDVMAGYHQQLDHTARARLVEFLEDGGPFAHMALDSLIFQGCSR